MAHFSAETTPGRNKAEGSLPVVLTIAGFDPSSGAGVTADLKVFSALGVYGMACITALTVQSTMGVKRVETVHADLVQHSLQWLAEDVSFAAIKIGMLGTGEVAGIVADFLDRHPQQVVVLDPVMRSSSGAELLDDAGVEVLRERLLGRVDWVTPNLEELAILTGRDRSEAVSADRVPALAFELMEITSRFRGPNSERRQNIVVTGGHLEGELADYLVCSGGASEWLTAPRVETTSTHGTGCAHSSALAALLGKEVAGREAARQAQAYVGEALRRAYPVGRGRGPMHHLWRIDKRQG